MKMNNYLLRTVLDWLQSGGRKGARLEYPPGSLGLEIECEGSDLPPIDNDLINVWIAKEDHSLRNGGIEYIFRQPLPSTEIYEQVKRLKEFLKKHAKLKMSHRCSVHAHLNVQQLSFQEVYTLICLYWLFENFMVEYAGIERIGNMYCLRSCDAEYLPLMIIRGLKTQAYLNDVATDNNRYSALNIKPIFSFGSLEFRAFRGTVEPDEVSEWTDIIYRLYEFSLEFNSPLDVLERFNSARSIDHFVINVWQKHKKFLDFILSRPSWQSDIRSGYIYSFEMANALSSEYSWIKDIREEKRKAEEFKKKNPKKEESFFKSAPPPVGWNIEDFQPRAPLFIPIVDQQAPAPRRGRPVVQRIPIIEEEEGPPDPEWIHADDEPRDEELDGDQH